MKLLIVIVASLAINRCATENRRIDELLQYKNHRSSTNDTNGPLYKSYISSVNKYSARFYANLSDVKDFTAATFAEKSVNKATEVPALQDAVRVFISPASENRKKQDYQPVATAQVSYSSSKPSMPSSSVHLVTAKSAPPTPVTGTVKDKKSSPVYSQSSASSHVNGTTDLSSPIRTTTTVTGDEPRFNNGAKVRKTPSSNDAQQQQPRLLYATTTPPTVPTAFAITAKVNSSNASKPFTTVLVPKQILDGDLVQHDKAHGDSSFRPIAPPTFVYKQNVDVNSIENRRVSNVVNAQATSVPKSVGHGFTVRPVTYKVEEFVGGNDQSSIVSDGGHGLNNKQDRYDHTYVPADRFNQEKVIFSPSKQEVSTKYDNLKYDVSNYEVPNYNSPKYDVPKQDLKYGFTVPESVKYEQQLYKNVHSPDQFRKFYPDAELPPKDVMSYPSYNSAGKLNVQPSQIEITGPSVDLEKSQEMHKEFSNSPPNRFASMNSETESNGSEFALGDVNSKYVLKSILRDMLKSKQQSETKSGSSNTMDEIIDSYFKTNRPNVDFSLDNYDIETGESVIYTCI